jgi:hypothetical protein
MINKFYDENDLLESDMYDLEDYQIRVSNLGKFESNPRYVPYMWDNLQLWGDPPDFDATSEAELAYAGEFGLDSDDLADASDLPMVWRYDVDLVDYVLFPELIDESIRSVYLYESDQGFVNVWDIKRFHFDVFQTIEDIDPRLTLITDSQEITAIGESIGKDLSAYGGLFVEELEGEYGSVYGYVGSVPYTYKSVDKIQ